MSYVYTKKTIGPYCQLLLICVPGFCCIEKKKWDQKVRKGRLWEQCMLMFCPVVKLGTTEKTSGQIPCQHKSLCETEGALKSHIIRRWLQISSSGTCIIQPSCLLLDVKSPYASKHPEVFTVLFICFRCYRIFWEGAPGIPLL